MKRDEQGIALVIALFLMATLSALAVSMMFLAQTETASSRNYRTMSQARYAGEAGIHSSVNYLINSYTAPTTFTNYDMTKSPVTCILGCANNAAAGASCTGTSVAAAVSSGCVVLSAMTGVSSNYPDTTIKTAFSAAAQGTMAVNGSGTTSNGAMGTVTYGAAAILMSMRQVNSYGGGSGVVQTWQIISDGTVPPSTAAIVEVSASLEREYADAETFAVFATGTGCGAISLNGNVSTDSYDSSTSPVTTTSSGGNVGTNGNLSIVGHVNVHGALSSPRTGVGSCVNGSGVDALTETGAATVDSGLVRLPQALAFATPVVSPLPPTTTMSSGATICAAISLPKLCSVSGSTVTIDPMGGTVSLGNLSGVTLVLKGGTYNVNSINGTPITTGTSAVGSNSTVVLNVAGKGSPTDIANPISLGSQAVANASMDPSKLQILYGGTGSIDMTGGSQAAAMLYAPNASMSMHGNSDFYGSVLVATMSNAGTPTIHYDRHLQSTFFTLGNYVMSSFSWKKY